jgi:hypothetical protein
MRGIMVSPHGRGARGRTVDRGTSAHRFVTRRGAATSAVKAIAEFGRDNLETDGSEIDTDVLTGVCAPARLRKLGDAGLSTFRAIEAFGPMVPPGHSPNMRLRQA